MDVTCERCGTEYEFDETLVAARGTTVKCTQCGHLFKVFRQEEESAAKTWLVRKRGTSLGKPLKTLRDLQRMIASGEVTREDDISRSGEGWKRLGDIAELMPFFTSSGSESPVRPADRPPSGTTQVASNGSHTSDSAAPASRASSPTPDRTSSPTTASAASRSSVGNLTASDSASTASPPLESTSERPSGSGATPPSAAGSSNAASTPKVGAPTSRAATDGKRPPSGSSPLPRQIARTSARPAATNAASTLVGVSTSAPPPKSPPRPAPNSGEEEEKTIVSRPDHLAAAVAKAAPRPSEVTTIREDPDAKTTVASRASMTPSRRGPPTLLGVGARSTPTAEAADELAVAAPDSSREPNVAAQLAPSANAGPPPYAGEPTPDSGELRQAVSSSSPSVPPRRVPSRLPTLHSHPSMFAAEEDEYDPFAAVDRAAARTEPELDEPFEPPQEARVKSDPPRSQPRLSAAPRTIPPQSQFPASPARSAPPSGPHRIEPSVARRPPPPPPASRRPPAASSATSTGRATSDRPVVRTDVTGPQLHPSVRPLHMEVEDRHPSLPPSRSRSWLWVSVVLLMAIGVGIFAARHRIAPLLQAPPRENRIDPFLAEGDSALQRDTEADWQHAIEAYTKVLGHEEREPRALTRMSRAYALLAQNRIYSAVALELDESDAARRAEAGLLRREAGGYAEHARELAELAARYGPDDPDTEVALADALRLSGDPSRAASRLARAAEMSPEPDAERLRVQALLAADRAGSLAAARSLAQRAVEADPALLRARLLLARAQLAGGARDAAIHELEATLRRSPEHSTAAALLAQTRDTPSAPQTSPTTGPTERAIAAPPRTPPPRSAPERAAERGRTERTPVQEPPEPALDTTPRSYESLVRDAERRLERGDPRQARVLFEQALRVRPSAAEATSGLGYVLLAEGKPREAVSQFETARRNGYVDALIGLGAAYRQLNQLEDALGAYEAYLQRLPNGPRASIANHQSSRLREVLAERRATREAAPSEPTETAPPVAEPETNEGEPAT